MLGQLAAGMGNLYGGKQESDGTVGNQSFEDYHRGCGNDGNFNLPICR